MIHRFIIEIETDEATTEELKEAIASAIEYVELPNGDGLSIDNPQVEIYSGL